MSMTRADARIYIGRVIGGAGDDKVWDLAEEALLRAFSDWGTTYKWEGLLKDTSLTTTLSCTTNSDTVINPVTAGDLDFVNVGQTITGGPFTGTATVLSYTRGSDGAITAVTVDLTASSTGASNLTFSADIPIRVGVQDYNPPTDFMYPYMARLTSKAQWPIEFIRPRFWNRRTLSSTVQGLVEAYTLFNVNSPNTQRYGTKRIRLYRIPSATDVLQLTYYRKFVALSDPLDMDEQYLYKFLDYARGIVLELKRAQDNPELYLKLVATGMQNAMTADEEVSEDEDKRMISQMEVGDAQRPLWTNGPFNPDYGF